ncbi:MAG: hypothetical protein KAI76_07350 [Alphaproteobacteria bacterium]|nr:hypothetical protein [Alphaproteobacteria bacterium]
MGSSFTDKAKKYAIDPGIIFFVGHCIFYSTIPGPAFALSIISLGVAAALKSDQMEQEWRLNQGLPSKSSGLKRFTSRLFSEETKIGKSIGKFADRKNAALAINGAFLIGMGFLSGNAALFAQEGAFLNPFLGFVFGLAYGFGNIRKANEIDHPVSSDKKSGGFLSKVWMTLKKPETLSCIGSISLAVSAAGLSMAPWIVALTIVPALYLSITSQKDDQKMIEEAASEKLSRSAQSRRLIAANNFLSSVAAFAIGNLFVGMAQVLFGTGNSILVGETDKKEKERIENLAKKQETEKEVTSSHSELTPSPIMSL